MTNLAPYIRRIVFLSTLIISVLIYLFVRTNFDSPDLQKIRLVQIYALAAVTYLYFALLASPLYMIFPGLPFKSLHLVARRAIGVSAFFFGVIHGSIAFFGLLGGFSGIGLLSPKYLTSAAFGFTALLILSVMAATSFNWAVAKLGRKWKMLHRLVYAAAVLIVIHALMLGTHFIDLSTTIPKLFFIFGSILLVLEAIRFDRFLAEKITWLPKVGVSLAVSAGLIVYAGGFLKSPEDGNTSLGIHSQHVELAKKAQDQSKGFSSDSQLPSNIPGLDGDRSKRYTVDFDHPETIRSGQETRLTFKVFDASTGSPVTLFKTPYEKVFHLIIVDNSLQFFNHIHPVQTGSKHTIVTKFPKGGVYRLYTDFQPFGGIEQQVAFTLTVGNPPETVEKLKVDQSLTKTFGKYEVTLTTPGTLRAESMSLGQQKISFTIKDAETKEPITNLKPYLNAFGHLVMINQENYSYLHVHPYDLSVPEPNQSGGPEVQFLPIGIYGEFSPGIHRVFGQFNHNGKLFVADFTVGVE